MLVADVCPVDILATWPGCLATALVAFTAVTMTWLLMRDAPCDCECDCDDD